MSLAQAYTGKARYLPDHPSGAHRLFVAIPCSVEDLPTPIFALLDTASEWCVLPANVGTDLGLDLDPAAETFYFASL